MDNFYTRHTLALDVAKFCDGDIDIIGTVKGNLIDAINRGNILKALDQLAEAPRNHWNLVRAHEVVKKSKSKKRKGCTQKNTMDAYLTSSKSKVEEASTTSKKNLVSSFGKTRKGSFSTQMISNSLPVKIFFVVQHRKL